MGKYEKMKLDVDEECTLVCPGREVAVGASHGNSICVCSFRVERKKAVRQVEPLRDCCVNA